MPMPTWPSGLPSPYADENSAPAYAAMDNVIRSSPDVGPGKVRRRFTGKYERLGFTMVLTPTQRAIFIAFYEGTLKTVASFTWIDLRTGLPQNYRFSAPLKEAWVAGDSGAGWWRVAIELETVP